MKPLIKEGCYYSINIPESENTDPYLPTHVIAISKDPDKRGYWLVKDIRDLADDQRFSIHKQYLDYPNKVIYRYPADLPQFSDEDILAINSALAFMIKCHADSRAISSLKALKIKLTSCQNMRNV